MRSGLVVLILVASAIGAPGNGAEKTPATSPAGKTNAAPGHVLDRIAVIGASATAGFGTDLNFGQALEATIVRAHQPISQAANLLFYSHPGKTGATLLEEALKAKPTLVVGVDFLFWFGYGSSGPNGKPIRAEESRLDLLAEGLKLVEKIQCPLVLGDFSDMSSAVGMLQPEQIPAKKTLAALNQRLREWAKDKPNVMVLPFAQLIDDIHAGKPFKIGKNEWSGDRLAGLIQEDKLHPTAEGLVAISLLVADEVMARKTGAQPKDFNLDPAAILKKLDGMKEPAGETAAKPRKIAPQAGAPKKAAAN